jgi:hypothetical protein
LGNVISNLIKRCPKANESLKNGIPLFFTVLTYPGDIISPGAVEITIFSPLKCLISKLKPVKASTNVIFLSIYKSAPFLTKVECRSIFILTTRSPASIPGASSPSLEYKISCSCGTPGSKATYII